MKLFIFTDGGSRGNPGPAAIGIVVKDQGKNILAKISKRIGKTTNNIAEYTAIIEALKWAKEWFNKKKEIFINNESVSIEFFLDSKLVVNQLNGIFKIKDWEIRELFLKIRQLEGEIPGKIFYQFIPRKENQLADFLVNKSFKE